mmetsp:Transcript_31054/g.51476  ORF Transcript_31054/g.51476 Transcript_31054/m.51476 type:complete len:285 (-) Transcript_31054:551-1405(-)
MYQRIREGQWDLAGNLARCACSLLVPLLYPALAALAPALCFIHSPNAFPTQRFTSPSTSFMASARPALPSAGKTSSVSARISASSRSHATPTPRFPSAANVASSASNFVSALAIARCTAAASVARSLPFPFFSARGCADLESTWVATASSWLTSSMIGFSSKVASPPTPLCSLACNSLSSLTAAGCGSLEIFHLYVFVRPPSAARLSTSPSPCSPCIHAQRDATRVQSEPCASVPITGTPCRCKSATNVWLLLTRTAASSTVVHSKPRASACFIKARAAISSAV